MAFTESGQTLSANFAALQVVFPLRRLPPFIHLLHDQSVSKARYALPNEHFVRLRLDFTSSTGICDRPYDQFWPIVTQTDASQRPPGHLRNGLIVNHFS